MRSCQSSWSTASSTSCSSSFSPQPPASSFISSSICCCCSHNHHINFLTTTTTTSSKPPLSSSMPSRELLANIGAHLGGTTSLLTKAFFMSCNSSSAAQVLSRTHTPSSASSSSCYATTNMYQNNNNLFGDDQQRNNNVTVVQEPPLLLSSAFLQFASFPFLLRQFFFFPFLHNHHHRHQNNNNATIADGDQSSDFICPSSEQASRTFIDVVEPLILPLLPIHHHQHPSLTEQQQNIIVEKGERTTATKKNRKFVKQISSSSFFHQLLALRESQWNHVMANKNRLSGIARQSNATYPIALELHRLVGAVQEAALPERRLELIEQVQSEYTRLNIVLAELCMFSSPLEYKLVMFRYDGYKTREEVKQWKAAQIKQICDQYRADPVHKESMKQIDDVQELIGFVRKTGPAPGFDSMVAGTTVGDWHWACTKCRRCFPAANTAGSIVDRICIHHWWCSSITADDETFGCFQFWQLKSGRRDGQGNAGFFVPLESILPVPSRRWRQWQ